MSEWTIGIIGGSGLYAMDALEDPQWIDIATPWGRPSDALLIGRVEGVNGIKTGYTRASGFNVVTSLQRNGRTVIAVVMGGRSARSRDQEVEALLSTVFPQSSFASASPGL